MPMQAQLVRSPAFQDIYSNNATMSLTPYDGAITFGRLSNFGTNGFVEELATVRMSPQQIVLLARSLSAAAEAWQAEFGVIDVSSTPAMSVEQMRGGLRATKEALKQNAGLNQS